MFEDSLEIFFQFRLFFPCKKSFEKLEQLQILFDFGTWEYIRTKNCKKILLPSAITFFSSFVALFCFSYLFTIMDIIFCHFLMLYQIFLSQQVKRNVISNKLVYTSCLTSCQTTKDLGSQEIKKHQEYFKALLNYSLVLSLIPKAQNLPILAKIC